MFHIIREINVFPIKKTFYFPKPAYFLLNVGNTILSIVYKIVDLDRLSKVGDVSCELATFSQFKTIRQVSNKSVGID